MVPDDQAPRNPNEMVRRSGLRLHLRARRVGTAACALLVLAGLLWISGKWLAGLPWSTGPSARVPAVVLGPLLAVVVTSRTLAGADLDLDRTSPRLSANYRLIHALLSCGIPAVAVALVLLPDPAVFGAAAAARNTLGLMGLVLVSACLGPPALAWAPATVLTLTTYLAGGRARGAGASWWAWLMQNGDPDPSWVVAGFALIVGVTLYALRGPHSTPGQR